MSLERINSISSKPRLASIPRQNALRQILSVIQAPTQMTRASIVATGLALASANCGGSVQVEGDQMEILGCDPVPDCPDIPSPINPKANFYLDSKRWARIDPESGEVKKVCEPVERDFCSEGQDPEIDKCSLPVCEGAVACDPIPSRAKNGGYRWPERANYPTSSEQAYSIIYVEHDETRHPIIYDSAPDCEPGESPIGESYYSCDIIPTCPEEEQIAYCEPLRRCEPGESPIVCEEKDRSVIFEDEQTCKDFMNDVGAFFWRYSLDVSPVMDAACISEMTPHGFEAYRPPVMTIQCLPTPECENGEIAQTITRSIPIDCGRWGSWVSEYSYGLSCDPIKSCR